MTTATIHIDATPPGPRARADAANIPGWGADLRREDRPAVPRERTPPRLDVPWDQPEAQVPTVEVLHSIERPGLTPVFGTTVPPSGASGMLRRLAFRLSESDVRHWLLLLLADRVNVLEGLVQDLVHGRVPQVLQEMGLNAHWREHRERALRAVAALAGLALALIALVRRLF